MTATTELQGLRVLLVEDETLICLLMEDMLAEFGCEIIGPASDIERAIALASGGESIDAAILDVNLGRRVVFPVADILTERGIPFLFATGAGAAGLPGVWQGHPTVSKPMTMAQLADALSKALLWRPKEVEAGPLSPPEFAGGPKPRTVVG